MPIVIFLNSCNKPVEVKRVDTTANQFNNYEVTFNKTKCEFDVKDAKIPNSPLFDPSINGMVCVTKEVYKDLSARLKTECRNAQTQTSTP